MWATEALPLTSPLRGLHSSWLSDGHLSLMHIMGRRGRSLIRPPLKIQDPKSSGHTGLAFVISLLVPQSHYIYAAGSSEGQMPAATGSSINLHWRQLLDCRQTYLAEQRMAQVLLSDGSL